MSKRFTDTTKWNRPWFRDLSPAEKCAWDYITSWCDNVGVWVPDFKGAEFNIGEGVDWEEFRTKVNGNIRVLENGKWWLVDFCAFQYGKLSENSRIHQSYLKLLLGHGLLGVSKGYPYPMDTPKDKDKDKDKDKEQDKNIALSGKSDTGRDPLRDALNASFLAKIGSYANPARENANLVKLAQQIRHKAGAGDTMDAARSCVETLWQLHETGKEFWSAFTPSRMLSALETVWGLSAKRVAAADTSWMDA